MILNINQVATDSRDCPKNAVVIADCGEVVIEATEQTVSSKEVTLKDVLKDGRSDKNSRGKNEEEGEENDNAEAAEAAAVIHQQEKRDEDEEESEEAVEAKMSGMR